MLPPLRVLGGLHDVREVLAPTVAVQHQLEQRNANVTTELQHLTAAVSLTTQSIARIFSKREEKLDVLRGRAWVRRAGGSMFRGEGAVAVDDGGEVVAR